MARPKKIIETPGENTAAIQDIDLTAALQVKQADIAGAVNGIGETVTPTPSAALDSPRPAPYDLTAATADEIAALFDWYGFIDQRGQPITACADFQQLVSLALAPAMLSQSAAALIPQAETPPKRNTPVLTEHGWLVK